MYKYQALKISFPAVITTSLILGTYIVGWVPSILVFVLICGDNCPIYQPQMTREHPRMTVALRIVVKSLIILKTLVNPVVYAARVHEIQVALRRMHWSICWLCRGKQTTTLGGSNTTIRRSSVPFSNAAMNNRYVMKWSCIIAELQITSCDCELRSQQISVKIIISVNLLQMRVNE